MFIKRFFEPKLAQTSYMIGCLGRERMHRHRSRTATPSSTSRRPRPKALGSRTSPRRTFTRTICPAAANWRRAPAPRCTCPTRATRRWKYALRAASAASSCIKNGDRITIGNVQLDVVHTPGHTPEHLTFLVTDGAAANEPIAAATGDFIFVGDVGRPDLLERAANMKGTMEVGAKTLYREPAAVRSAGRTGCRSGRAMAPDRRAARASARFRTARWATSGGSTGRFRRRARSRVRRRACWPASRSRRSILPR